MKIKSILALFVFCLSLGFSGLSFAQEKMQLLFYERPPYSVPDGKGGVTGITADVAVYALEKAKISFECVNLPSQRILATLQDNNGKDASVNWYKTPEREKFAKFSNALYQDKQIVLLARKDNAKIANQTLIDSLLADQSLTVLVKTGFSYGKFLDDKIAKLKPKVQESTNDNVGMLKMIDGNRADYMFISPEEADVSIKASGIPADIFQQITLKDMPPGEKRYIMYSQKVDDATIVLVNEYINEYLSTHK